MATTSFQGGGYPGRPYGSFAGREPFVPPVVVTDTPSGGWEYERLGRRRRTHEEIRRSRIEYGIFEDDARVVESVAERQAADTRLDEEQRAQELRGELGLKGIEMRSEHLRALNDRREAIATEKIGRYLRALQQKDEETILLLMAAAAVV